MRTVGDVERFLKEAAVNYRDLGSGFFVVEDPGSGHHRLGVKVEDEVVLFQLQVQDLPRKGEHGREELLEHLLRLNGEGGMLHAAFCVWGTKVMLQAALPLDNLDANEVQAVLDDIGLAVSQHVPRLAAADLHSNVQGN